MHQNQQKLEEICDQIKSIDVNADSIRQSNLCKMIGETFQDTIRDDKQLSEIFDMFNARALEDEEFILSLVSVITSRQLESFTVNGKVLRHAMLSVLQKNFQNADNYKRDNMNKFYNSIRLLGEYFNRARLPSGSAINIIGQSMLNLINVELEKELRNICHLKSDEFARLVLSQIALNGNLLKTRHKTEIEQVLLTIRKCNIEISSLTPKTRAFFHMTLDLYYSNYTNVGDTLEKMYKTYLVEDIEAGTIVTPPIENGRVSKAPENETIQETLEELQIVKKPDQPRKVTTGTPRNLKVQIKKQEPFRTGPISPQKTYRDLSLPRSGPPSPQKHSRDMSLPRNGPVSPKKGYRDMSLPRSAPTQSQKPNRDMSLPRTGSSPSYNNGYRDMSLPRNPQKASSNGRFYSSSNRNPQQATTSRYAPQSPTSRYAQPTGMNNPKSPSSKFRPPHSSSPTRKTPPQRSSSQPPGRKLSPQELRNQKSSQSATNGSPLKPSRSSSAIRSPKVQSTNSFDNESRTESSESTHQNGTDDYVLRQQNSRSSTPSLTAVPARYKINNSKVYFREENVENLTWHGEGSNVADGLDEPTSPKVNPYSSSFLNFLSSN